MNKKVVLVARLILGLIFFVFGCNGAMMIVTGKGFIPMPPMNPEMAKVMGGLFAAKFIMPSVKIIEILSGVLLLSNKCVALAIALLAPVVFNILGVHLFVDLGGLPMALLITASMVILYIDNWPKFKAIFEK